MMRVRFLAFALWLVVAVSAAHAQRELPANDVQYLKADTASALPFSDAVRVGGMLYLSGIIAIDDSMKLVPGGMEAEAHKIMDNARKVLERNGSSMDHIIKATVMLADIKEWAAFNAVYRAYFRKGRLPARSAFGTSGLAFGARAEVEFWATVR